MSVPQISELAQAAIAMHELFMSLVAGGFSEHQALTLIGTVMAQGLKNAQEVAGDD